MMAKKRLVRDDGIYRQDQVSISDMTAEERRRYVESWNALRAETVANWPTQFRDFAVFLIKERDKLRGQDESLNNAGNDAENVLIHLLEMEQAAAKRGKDNQCAALYSAMMAGRMYERLMVRFSSPYLRTGQTQHRHSKSVNAKRHAKAQARYEKMQRRAVELRKENPRDSIDDIRADLAEEFGVSTETVKKAVKIPPRQKTSQYLKRKARQGAPSRRPIKKG